MAARKLSFATQQEPAPPEGEPEAAHVRPLLEVQKTIKQLVDRVNETPGPLSKLTDPATFTAAGSAIISHRLGRQPVRWYAEDVTGGYGGFQRLAWNDRTITIQAIFACTATFRVE